MRALEATTHSTTSQQPLPVLTQKTLNATTISDASHFSLPHMTKLISVELKEEGNKLYAQKNYSEAYQKYTAAITEDAKNPVLYANRAACSMGQKM